MYQPASLFALAGEKSLSRTDDEFGFHYRLSVHIWAVQKLAMQSQLQSAFIQRWAVQRYALMKRWDVEFHRVYDMGWGDAGLLPIAPWNMAKQFVADHPNPGELVLQGGLFNGSLESELYHVVVRVHACWLDLDAASIPPYDSTRYDRRQVVGLDENVLDKCKRARKTFTYFF